ncbi:histone-lysine N-methyltransferase SETMAR [Trichonephila clavata]|uniref:Histone-lysine N-methyltransferase SETMAR n=1 Tax=Trichonephila clavata TaxID=2740835 RepID=A0A8X6GSI1_TRICU|nr:histone-lysine N-methyltransferase SETMAR [Trichonephila clavata]
MPQSSGDLIHHSFLKPGETIQVDKYYNEIDYKCTRNVHKQLPLINKKSPIYHHDCAGPHALMITRQKLHALGYKTLDHPLYSFDLSPTDYHFFKHLDYFLQEKCFRNPRDAATAFNDFVASKTAEFYKKKALKKLVSSCQKCVEANVSYFD